MIKGLVLKIKEGFASFSRKEKLFLFCAMLCGFFISADYAIIRPVSNSLFIHAYGSSVFPYAWLLAIPLNLVVVGLYNAYLPVLGCFRMLFASATIIVLGNIFCAEMIGRFSFLPFLFYIWKEIYVMLMFQQLWSVIHATIQLKDAKYLYGILFGLGALGGFCGSLVPSFCAVKVGSEGLVYASLPIYCFLVLTFFYLLKYAGRLEGVMEREAAPLQSLSEGVKLIASSKLLLSILCMVCFMQITATLTDFQFHSTIEVMFPDKDVRTAFIGKVASFGNVLTMSFQFIGTFLLVHFLGVQKIHLFIPAILALNAISFAIFPAFNLIAYCFVVIKCFDFSVFGVTKEMLYIPLKIKEKFQAKAIIDVFMYRTAKAFASFLILGLQLLTVHCSLWLSWVNISLCILWGLLVFSRKEIFSEAESIQKTEMALEGS